jgi:formate hydrogenlyase subunit 3/multisubunit Na+/H+ antiporter MnhD subunit
MEFGCKLVRNSGLIAKFGGAGYHWRRTMQNLIKVMVGLAAMSFLLAVAGCLNLFSLMGLPPESLSRACTNLT